MILLENGIIVTSEKEEKGTIVIDEGNIVDVLYTTDEGYPLNVWNYRKEADQVIDIEGKHVIAGGIDAHVHFREPGLTHKADMATESLAAVAGGVTTAMDMPNTSPATTSAEALKGKLELAKEKSVAKLSFHIGATNSNVEQICNMLKEGDQETGITPDNIAGVKVFMGSSTGNMLVDSGNALEELLQAEIPMVLHP